MKTKLLLLLFVFAAALRGEPTKIKFGALMEIGSALRQMDGAERVVEQGKDVPPRIVRLPYDFKPATRLALARNLANVRLALDAFEQTRQALLQSISGGAIEKVEGSPQLLAKFVSSWNTIAAEPVVVDLTVIAEDDLNLGTNALPPTVIAGLGPMLATKK